MSCLNVKATLLNLPVVVRISLFSGIECYAAVLNQPLRITIKKVSPSLKIQCGLVCSTNKDAYLRVVPDVVWLTPDMLSGEFDIYSNVVWRID